ncbi:MAG TPA: pentapeptide repeat-containing protein [Pseudonocardiaceae bacterium]
MGRSLIVTCAVSLMLLVAVSGWLLADGTTSNADALKTGGLAAGAVVALYALWLNDRRRQVEERRQDIERRRQELETERHALDGRRAEHDRERVADERFARAVELLGNPADQVRVGALHALAGLARSRPEYTQTVLDVVCSYLRRPFDHPHYADDRGRPPPAAVSGAAARAARATTHADAEAYAPPTDEEREADRERQVRRAAQRIITELLGPAGTGAAYDLDLTDATLEYLDLRGLQVGDLVLRYARLYRSAKLDGLRVGGTAWLTRATFHGPFSCVDAGFERSLVLSEATFRHDLRFDGTRVGGALKLAEVTVAGRASFTGARVDGGLDLTRATFDGDLDLRTEGAPAAHTIGMTVDTRREIELPAGWTPERIAGTPHAHVR